MKNARATEAGLAGQLAGNLFAGRTMAYQAAQEKAIFQPFTQATGIKVVPVPLSTGKLREILETGRIPVDVQFLVETYQIDLERGGYLDPIDYDAMRFTNPNDIAPSVRRPSWSICRAPGPGSDGEWQLAHPVASNNPAPVELMHA